MTEAERQERIAELQRCIDELRVRLPRHTPTTRMLVELDELEDELASLAHYTPDRPLDLI